MEVAVNDVDFTGAQRYSRVYTAGQRYTAVYGRIRPYTAVYGYIRLYTVFLDKPRVGPDPSTVVIEDPRTALREVPTPLMILEHQYGVSPRAGARARARARIMRTRIVTRAHARGREWGRSNRTTLERPLPGMGHPSWARLSSPDQPYGRAQHEIRF